MRSLVVLCAVIAAAVAAPSLYVPSAVSHQSRVDVHSSPAVVTQYVAEPVVATHVVAEPVVEARAVYAAPAAVSHQSRVDVRSSPAVVASVPVVASAPVVEPVVAYAAAPVSTVYAGGSAVSHQSRVDVQSSPAVVSEHLVAPVVEARSVLTPAVYNGAHSVYGAGAYGHGVSSIYGAHAGLGLSHGHLLKKRSLAHVYAPVAHVAHIAPSAVSHQSRVDVISKPAVVSEVVSAPVAVAHAVPSVSYAHVAPLAHSAVWTAPAAHLSHSGLFHSALW
ncbi:cuticle protein 38-like [Ostrinia furnacalis]|uniref:cuticle protein 38-like n=1 Tax=Ostrinia furnacalis TaxID=93504 RepID=UPI001038D73B|nr:cuticle protein 38-like [Ostrinia furnacalis]